MSGTKDAPLRLRAARLPRGTPIGRRAGLIGLGLLFAGFNTGNNLFYLMFALMASCELVGFRLAGRAVRRLQASVSIPPRGHVGVPLRVSITLGNQSRWLSVPSLTWKVAAAAGEVAQVVTPSVPPGGSTIATGRCLPSRRGPLTLVTLEGHTDFPLGLARRTVRAAIDPARSAARTIVAPRLGKPERESGGHRRGDVRRLMNPKGSGEEPIDAREYHPGDDARRIDWKASARTDRLMWRDRRGDPPRASSVRLDRSGEGGPRFEARVSRAAATVAAAIARGRAVGFITDEWELPPRTGPAQRRAIFDYLAIVEPAGSPAAAPTPAVGRASDAVASSGRGVPTEPRAGSAAGASSFGGGADA